jgi:hypothetical protein
MELATNYYKEPFGLGMGNLFAISPGLWQANENVSVMENEYISRPFEEEEIRSALLQMEKNKAVGPDGMPIEFFQSCWDIIKMDMLDLFNDFHQGKLDVKRINYGIITLLPKVKSAERIQQFMLICLLNCIYKWVTKCLTIRLESVAGRIIHISQTTFLKGSNIMNSILALHEILHETKKNRKTGVLLKLDFEKAYDKVDWGFLLKCLEVRGFNSVWCGWIKGVLENGTVAVKLNNSIGPYFLSFKGVRQGGSLVPPVI